ncbi:MAG: flagellar export protein FliJ [Deltaproteobacteria bacterium]|nr:MAG: flagellar export protein FliJ [Deltaproteobacteria bacterium]
MIYKFPFEAVLRHRKFLEESLQRELGDMKRALLDKRKKLQSLKKAGESFSEVLRKKIEGKSIKGSEVQLYTRFIERLSRQMDLEKKSISALVNDVEEKRQELKAAMKDRKVIEKLKEKGLESFRLNIMKKEQIFLNEMAAVRFDGNENMK